EVPVRAPAVGSAARSGPRALRRHEAAAHDRACARARAEAAHPRRADRRGGHRDPPLHVGLPAADQRRRHDHHPDDALPRGGREPVPPRRDHRRRPHHRGREHGRGPEEAAARVLRAEPQGPAARRAGARRLRGRADERLRARGHGRRRARPERAVRAAEPARHPGLEHAQQGESPRGAVPRAGGRAPGVALCGLRTGSIVDLRLNRIALETIVLKEFNRIVRIWLQTIVPPAITMTLYFVIFGSLIGRRVGTMEGFDYMQYIAPGLIMMSVITNSYGNVVSSFFGAKFGRHIEEMLVSPMSYATIIVG